MHHTFMRFPIHSLGEEEDKIASRMLEGVLVPLQVGDQVLILEEQEVTVRVEAKTYAVQSGVLEVTLGTLVMADDADSARHQRLLLSAGWKIS